MRCRLLTMGLVATLAGVAGVTAQRGPAGSQALQDASAAIRTGRGSDAVGAVHRELQANPSSTAAASLLDTLGLTDEARPIFQRAIDAGTDPAGKAAANRAMAMSYAFTGDCADTVTYESRVIYYWKTRESAEPQNAFYQEGEMANEAARVCIDSGDVDTAEHWYREGTALGLKEPSPKTHPAVRTSGNENDPFLWCLLAMAHGHLGQSDVARTEYTKAFDLATAHNPPSAYVRRIARKMLGLPVPSLQ